MHVRAIIVGILAVAVVATGVTVAVVELPGHSHSVQAKVDAQRGGSVDVGNARLSVPPGSVSGSGQLIASTGGAPSASSGLAGGLALASSSAPVHFEVTGARLTGPLEVSFRVGTAQLPQGLPKADGASAIWLAYYDSATRQWQPVASHYDPRTGMVTAQVQHLSWWAPWTWDLQDFALRLRQLLSAFGSGRAPAASCAGVPKVTVASVGGQDPPLIGCPAKRGANTLAVSITDNRGVSMVMSGVPPDATQDPPSYQGFDEYIATQAAIRQILGGADLAPSQTLTYTLPLSGPAEVFTAAPTLKSYALDLASIVGDALVGAFQFGKVSGAYATCIVNAVAGSGPASFADVPRVAVSCLPALGKAVPALKGLASTELGLLEADATLILQDYDLANDAIHGVTGQINIARLAIAGGASAPCTQPAMTSAVAPSMNAPREGGVKWAVATYVCRDGYALADINVVQGLDVVAILKQQGSSWIPVYGPTEGLCIEPVDLQFCPNHRLPLPLAVLQTLEAAIARAPAADLYINTAFTPGALYQYPFGPPTIGIDNHDSITNIKWAAGSQGDLIGTGTLNYDKCNPDCASGPLGTAAVQITASNPQRCTVQLYPNGLANPSQTTQAEVFSQLDVQALQGSPPSFLVGGAVLPKPCG
jgi:hypothetical protein